MSPRAELDDRLIDQALARHFSAPPPDLAPRVRAALEESVPPSLTPEEVARLVTPRGKRQRPYFVLAAAAALLLVLLVLRDRRRTPAPEPLPPPVAERPEPVPEARFEALRTALFTPGAHAPVSDPYTLVHELVELERALGEEPARWPRLAAALLAPDLAGAAVAPLDFLHVLTDARALEPARALWQRDPSAFGDIHLASFAELGDADFQAELEALVELGEGGSCAAPVFSAAYLALRGDARGAELLRQALVAPCPDEPARGVAAALALEALGDSAARDLWLELVRGEAGAQLARARPLRAAAWLEADAALRAWRADPATFRLGRLHLVLLEREEQRRAAPLDATALERELAALER